MDIRSLKSWVSLSAAAGTLGLAYFSIAAPKKNQSAVNYDAQIRAALPKQSSVQALKPRKVLIFSVTNGFRHKSIATGKRALTLMGQKTGAYTAVVSDDLENLERDKLAKFDAVLFLSTTGNVFAPRGKLFKAMTQEQRLSATKREKRLQKNLMDFIKSGKGFVGIHAASDTYYNWPEYGEMIGGYFDGHPWNSKTDVSIQIEPGKENHPIVAALKGEPLNFKEEIYQFKEPYDSSKYDMLLRLDPENSNMEVKGIKRTDKDFGVAWAKTHGQGRVFYCSLGHNDHIYWNDKVLAHYLAGIQYALGDLKLKNYPKTQKP